MEISHPGAAPLQPAQLALLEDLRQRLHKRELQGGLTPDDVREMVEEIRHHPDMSFELVEQLFVEARKFLPEHVFSFDWE